GFHLGMGADFVRFLQCFALFGLIFGQKLLSFFTQTLCFIKLVRDFLRTLVECGRNTLNSLEAAETDNQQEGKRSPSVGICKERNLVWGCHLLTLLRSPKRPCRQFWPEP